MPRLLRTEMMAAAPRGQIFAFFSDAANLQTITPAEPWPLATAAYPVVRLQPVRIFAYRQAVIRSIHEGREAPVMRPGRGGE